MKLNIEVAFTDKNNGKSYKVGDVIEVNDTRGKELLKDSRRLVSLNNEHEVKVEKVKKEKEKDINE